MRVQNVIYAVLNPCIRKLLESRYHAIASHNILILKYKGRKSGREYQTPLSYVRQKDSIFLLSNYKTRWWRNFSSDPIPVEMLITGNEVSGFATLYTGQSALLLSAVTYFLTKLPRDARIYGVRIDAAGLPTQATINNVYERVVLLIVEVDKLPKRL